MAVEGSHWSLFLVFFESTKLFEVVGLKILYYFFECIALDSTLLILAESADLRDHVNQHIASELIFDDLFILVREDDRGRVLCRRVVSSPTPKCSSQQLTVIYISRLEQHSPVMLQHPLKEISAVKFRIAVHTPQPTRPSLLINEADVAGGKCNVDFFNSLGLQIFFPVDHEAMK